MQKTEKKKKKKRERLKVVITMASYALQSCLGQFFGVVTFLLVFHFLFFGPERVKLVELRFYTGFGRVWLSNAEMMDGLVCGKAYPTLSWVEFWENQNIFYNNYSVQVLLLVFLVTSEAFSSFSIRRKKLQLPRAETEKPENIHPKLKYCTKWKNKCENKQNKREVNGLNKKQIDKMLRNYFKCSVARLHCLLMKTLRKKGTVWK